MVERGEKFGRVLLSALIPAIAGLGVTEFTIRTISGISLYAVRLADTHVQMTALIAMFVKAGFPASSFAPVQRWTELCVTASVVTNVTLAFVFSLVMLGRLLAWRDVALRRPAAPSPYRFRFLSLPEWLLFAFVIGGLSPLASGMAQQIGANVLVVVSFLYFLQGMAIFRSFVAATGAGVIGSMFAWTVLGLLTVTGDFAAAALHRGAIRLVFRFPTFQSKGSL